MVLTPLILIPLMFLGGLKLTSKLAKEVKELKVTEYPIKKTEDLNKYIKVTYQTDPIGQRGIILYLTTFDVEAYEKDKSLIEIPKKEERIYVSVPNPDESIEWLESRLNTIVKKHYQDEIRRLERLLEKERHENSCNSQYLLNKRLERQRRELEATWIVHNSMPTGYERYERW